jgi:hypothetical protein
MGSFDQNSFYIPPFFAVFAQTLGQFPQNVGFCPDFLYIAHLGIPEIWAIARKDEFAQKSIFRCCNYKYDQYTRCMEYRYYFPINVANLNLISKFLYYFWLDSALVAQGPGLPIFVVAKLVLSFFLSRSVGLYHTCCCLNHVIKRNYEQGPQ